MENELLAAEASRPQHKKGGAKESTATPKNEKVITAQEAEQEVEIDPLKNYLFELLPQFSKGRHFGLSNICEVYDHKSGRRRIMRYVPHYDSIWKDEQPDNEISKTDHDIRFFVGKAHVPGSDKMKILFLLNHDRKEGNIQPISQRGPVFRVADPELQAKKSLAIEKLENDARSKALALFDEELLMVSFVLYGRHFDSEPQALQAVVDFAKSQPKKFLDICEDPRTKRRYLIQQGFDKGVIKAKFSMLKWGASDVDIVQLPPDKDMFDFVTDWSLSAEGKDFVTILKRQLA